MLLFVQVCRGSGLHHFHHCLCESIVLLLFKCDIELVKELRGNAGLLLHQVLRCVYVEGDPQ